MSTTNETREFRGYYRARKDAPWEMLVQHPDYGTTWSLLLDLVADRRGNGELLVSRTVPADGAPAGRRRRCY